VFDAAPGAAVNATLIDLGSRLRLIVAEVDAVPPDRPMPRLPVARAMWIPRPDFKRGCEAWILSGGAHHVSFSRAVTIAHLEDFAAMAGIELVHIGAGTEISALRNELRWNDAAYGMTR
jgi:L-arabinose isomerase